MPRILRVASSTGHSPLHKAAYTGRIGVCQWLLKTTRLTPSQKDMAGYNSHMIAREKVRHLFATTYIALRICVLVVPGSLVSLFKLRLFFPRTDCRRKIGTYLAAKPRVWPRGLHRRSIGPG